MRLGAGMSQPGPGVPEGATPDGAATSDDHGTRERRAAPARMASSLSRSASAKPGRPRRRPRPAKIRHIGGRPAGASTTAGLYWTNGNGK